MFIDTPGQIEVFTWSASGQIITETLASSFPTVSRVKCPKGTFGIRRYTGRPGYVLVDVLNLPKMSGTGIEFVPNLPGVFGGVLRPYRTLPRTLGRVFTEQGPPVYFGGYPTEHTL